jgi:hypothetical protein
MNTFYEENRKKSKNHANLNFEEEQHHDKIERKVSRSNCDLQHITLKKKNTQMDQNGENGTTGDKFSSSFKLKGPLKASKFKNKDKEMETID